MRCAIALLPLLVTLVAAGESQSLVVPTEDINRSIRASVAATVGEQPGGPGDVEITPQHSGDVAVPGSEPVTVEAKVMVSGKPSGVVPVLVELRRGRIAVKSWTTTACVKHFASVVVAGRRINRHEPLSEQAVSVERRDVTGLDETGYFTSLSDLGGMRARRTLLESRPIDRSALEPVPVVNRGDDLVVTAEVGTLRISLSATANEDGGIGDEIQVVNKDSKARLRARVTEAGQARLLF